MELFPAADEEQFEFIKSVINQSDYYMIISAGRYGSIHPQSGLSYTEMEYDYALKIGKPIIRLLHQDPFTELKGKFLEHSDEAREKLRAFRTKLTTGSLVRFWNNPEQLMAETVFALQDIQRRKPAIGWVRANEVDKDNEITNLKLKERVRRLEEKLKTLRSKDQTKLHLPTVDKCLQKNSRPTVQKLPQQIWLPIEEAFLKRERADEWVLINYFEKHALIGEDEVRLLIDALVLDNILIQSGFHYKLTPAGNKMLRAFRVNDYLDQAKTPPPPVP